jgi:cytochrome c oxidase subunit II
MRRLGVVSTGSQPGPVRVRSGPRSGPILARSGVARGVRLALLAGVTMVLATGCSVGHTFHGFGWPEHGITEQSHRMYNLWVGSVIAALSVGVLTWSLIFWCIIRYRKRGDDLPPQVRYNVPIETVYTVIPFVIIAVLFYYTARTETYVDKINDKTPPAVQVEVLAFQWNWKFTYRGETDVNNEKISTVGTPDVVPVLVVPTGERIRFIENSQDVIHSFWVPDMLFKRDVIPGVTNQFEVTIDREGAYVGHCAEMCGTYHSEMNFELRAVSQAQYAQFLALRHAGSTTQQALATILPATHGLATTTSPFTGKPNTVPLGG